MDLIRRDTDYAFRIAAALAQSDAGQKALSAKVLAKQTKVSYALTCKILQKLSHAGIARSTMGPKGGWKLAQNPEVIRFGHLVEAIQGPVAVNRCLMGDFTCPLQTQCPAHPKMAILQEKIDDFLKEFTLKEFVNTPENKGALR